MTKLAAAAARHRPTRVGPPHLVRGTMLFAVGLFVLIGVVCVVIAGGAWHHDPLGTFVLVALGAVAFVSAEFFRRIASRDPKGDLTLIAAPDEVVFERRGQVVDRLHRSAVGVVVLEHFGGAGVLAVSVRDPSGDLVGRWETGWLSKGPLRPWRALRRHGWPRILEDQGRPRWISKDAPTWVRAQS